MVNTGNTGAIRARPHWHTITADAVLTITRTMLLLLTRQSSWMAAREMAAEIPHSLHEPLQKTEEAQSRMATVLPRKRLMQPMAHVYHLHTLWWMWNPISTGAVKGVRIRWIHLLLVLSLLAGLVTR